MLNRRITAVFVIILLAVLGHSQDMLQLDMGAVQEIIKSGIINKEDAEKISGTQNISKDAALAAPVIENKKENSDKPSLIEELYPDETKTSFIRQFGYEIFRQPTTFAPIDNVPVGSDYIIGPGDTFVIYVSGKLVQQDTLNLTVDRDGRVSLPKSGSVFLWGMKFSEAEKLYAADKQLSHFEVVFEKSIARRSLKAMYRSVMSIGALVGMLFLKEEEMHNIQKIVRGKALGLPSEKVSGMLVLVG